jgi:hypothetical protein
MGRELAAVALAIVSNPEHFRTTPGGYFHGMVAKAKAGELHLERTAWAPCAARRNRNSTSGRAGEGSAIAVMGAGHGEACHHGHPFAAAGSGSSICGLPTIHSGASGVRLSPPSRDRAGGIPDFRPKAACQSRVIPLRRPTPPLPKPRIVTGRYRGPIPGLQ